MTTQALDPLHSDSPLIVYLDFKSPYAFLAKDPAYALEDEFGIAIDWRPLTLDIPSYLGSAKADDRGKVLESSRSPRQWNAVRYAYRDAKRYARLRDLSIKGTTKIWDSSLASIGMLWARGQTRDALKNYIDRVYRQFWVRELDIEDPEVIRAELDAAGCDCRGFDAFLHGPGRQLHDTLMADLHPSGIFGVPTYICGGQRYFGREHLPAVRWHLAGGSGPAPDIAYESGSANVLSENFPAPAETLVVHVDFRNPNAYLAIAPVRALEAEAPSPFEWRGVSFATQKRPDAAPDQSRSRTHFQTRGDYNAMDLQRYAERQNLTLGAVPRDLDTQLACIGLLWAGDHQLAGRYVEEVFQRLWNETLDITDASAIAALLGEIGAGADGFTDFAASSGGQRQAAIQTTAEEQGVIGTPAFQLGGELFIGREHLPLVRALIVPD